MQLDSSLFNPGFQSYKLSGSTLAVSHYAIPSPHQMHYHSTSFHILEYLTKFNHLQRFQDYVVYFDGNVALNFFSCKTRQVTLTFQFPIGKDFLFAPAFVIVSNYFIVTTGRDENLYLLQVKENGIELLQQLKLDVKSSHYPTILDAKITQNQINCLILGTADAKPVLSLISFEFGADESKVLGAIVGEKTPHFATIQDDFTFTVLADASFHLEASRIPYQVEPLEAENMVVDQQYLWTQTENDVTIHFSLSEPHSKHELVVRMQNDTISVQSSRLGHVFGGKVFDLILPHESIWTLEENVHVTIYLTKSNKKCRWVHVLEKDDGILETLDSETLRDYTDRLQKYTGTQESGMKEMLAMTEQTEMIDFNSESCSLATYSFQSGQIELVHQNIANGVQYLCPVNGSKTKFVCKADVDGAIFELKNSTTTNVEIFAALSYIRASKQDVSLIAVSEELDYCTMVESKRYLYVYANPQGDSTAVHYVVDLWEGQGTVSNALVIGLVLESEGLWILKEDSIVRVDFNKE